MSESKKMSSPYVVLDNRSLDQWKVTELKEELKRRKLTTKGLKDDLVKRLDEAVRAEVEEASQNHENGENDISQPEVPSDDATVEPLVAEKTTSIMDNSSANNESLEEDKITEKFDKNESLEIDSLAEKMDNDESLEKDSLAEKLDNDETSKKHNMTENLDDENMDNRDLPVEMDRVHIDDGLLPSAKKLVTEGEHGIQVLEEVSVETSVLVSGGMVSEEVGQQDLQNVEINNEGEVSNLQPEDGESKPESQSPKEEVKPNSSHIGGQVVEVSQVKSDSISIDTMSITEKNELKDNVIADDVKLELDVKPEMVQPSSSKLVLDGAKTESVVVDEDKFTTEEKDVNNAESINICKKNDSEDVGSPEKLNLDRSSGDDSMEEDALESKQIDSKFNSQDIGDISKKIELPLVKEDEPVDVMVEDTPAVKNTESTKDNSDPSVAPAKRKLHDQEAVTNSEVVKRQRRWNSEGVKVPEQHNSTNPSLSTTPKDAFQASMKHSFSRSDSSVSHEEPKERVVPPSSKPPTTSLRIDRFLRPFTLKAVQELLGKTGTVVSFWMDHIKTHCYVTYSSVEEAVETRNAVYNLQWPANGGRLLIAEFVDPSEVKSRTEAPLPSPLTPASATTPPATSQPPQQLPPPPPLLPPPPPLSLPPQSREPALPPPPPLHEKTEPPIMTLDDLFRKTRATPRIYYLPLSDEQVAAKVKSQGKTAKQSAGVAFRKEQQRSSFRDRFRCFPRTLHLFKNPNTRKLRSWIETN